MSSVTRLRIKNVRVLAPATMAPNTDGIDLDSVQDAMVEDSEFSVGDDALCVKSGWNVGIERSESTNLLASQLEANRNIVRTRARWAVVREKVGASVARHSLS